MFMREEKRQRYSVKVLYKVSERFYVRVENGLSL